MNDACELTIDKMVAGGLGLGRLADGLVVLVPLVLPGERVRVRPVNRRKSYIEARLIEVLEPAVGRVKAACPAYDRCGGCDLQHAGYDLQLELKQRILLELLGRSGKTGRFDREDILRPPLAAPAILGYRQRIRLRIEPDQGRLGFFRSGSHQVEPIRSCLLARPEINQALAAIIGQPLLNSAFSLELLLSSADRAVVLLLHCQRRPRPADLTRARTLAGKGGPVKEVLFAVAGQGMFASTGERADTGTAADLLGFTLATRERLGHDLSFRLEPGGFCQVNRAQNERLVNLLLDWAEAGPRDRVLDLFCGMGNFSLPLAFLAGEVAGFDLKRSAIRSAVRNARSLGLGNCRFVARDALAASRELLAANERFDLVLLDPPRQGCAEIIPQLAGLAPRSLIYISCDPATLARDLDLLKDAGFVADRIQLVDMFPQTHHIEVVARLSRG